MDISRGCPPNPDIYDTAIIRYIQNNILFTIFIAFHNIGGSRFVLFNEFPYFRKQTRIAGSCYASEIIIIAFVAYNLMTLSANVIA